MLAIARILEQMTVDDWPDCAVRVAVEDGRNVLKGECRSARLRDDDALRLLRPRVDSAILRFVIEPISIQTGSRKGAEMLNKERMEWKKASVEDERSRRQRNRERRWMLQLIRVSLKTGRIAPVEPHQRLLL